METKMYLIFILITISVNFVCTLIPPIPRIDIPRKYLQPAPMEILRQGEVDPEKIIKVYPGKQNAGDGNRPTDNSRKAMDEWAAGAASWRNKPVVVGKDGKQRIYRKRGETTVPPPTQIKIKTESLADNTSNRHIEQFQKIMKAKAENKPKKIDGIARQNPMVYMEGNKFKMGVNDPTSKTGEYPVKAVAVKPFKLDRYPVTNGDFMVFKRKKIRYRTLAEKNGHSWVFFADKMRNATISEEHPKLKSAPWWYGVENASWIQPAGAGSDVLEKLFYPVVHISYLDAQAFCHWAGKRLSTEHEWEYAVRGGLNGMRYPWGDKYKRKRANLWQGLFPAENHKVDGYYSLAPVNAFEAQNNFGFYDMVGNAWEWTSTIYKVPRLKQDLTDPHYVAKGGSFVDSRDGRFNHEARCAARLGLRPNYTAGNIGFRCAKTVTLPKPKEMVEKHLQTTPRPPKHHKYEDTWAFKVKQVVNDVFASIKDSVKKIKGEL